MENISNDQAINHTFEYWTKALRERGFESALNKENLNPLYIIVKSPQLREELGYVGFEDDFEDDFEELGYVDFLEFNPFRPKLMLRFYGFRLFYWRWREFKDVTPLIRLLNAIEEIAQSVDEIE